MPIVARERYILTTFNQMHEKLNNAFEEISDGDFEDCKQTINSLIHDLRDVKKSMDQ
tara:strand:- start:1378 stop:1548 length:171 start_codon:yes stop_codon:yes gene_type:complete